MSDIALAAYAKIPGAEPAVALILNGQVFDLQEARKAGLKLDEAWAENSVPRIVAQWTRDTQALKSASAELAFLAQSGALKSVPDGARKLTAPYRPDRIFCAASNYIEHANEMGTVLAAKAESKPYMFLKLRNTVIGPGADIQMPPETSMLDWEIELAAVIGKGGRRIPAASALDHVAGYSIVNDISARDLNVRNDYPFKFDWFQGKCHDTFAPFGPTIVPAWAIADPQNVAMELKVNGQIMQSDTTANMIWTLREQIAYISTIVTLEPGDVIATGTPTGVGMGRDIYLKAGDVVSASIAVIGTLTNTVRAEKV